MSGAEQDRVSFEANVLSGRRQRLTMTFNGDASNISLDKFEFVIVLASNDLQNPASFSQHLRAGAITGQPRYERFHVLKLNPGHRLFSSGRQLRGT